MCDGESWNITKKLLVRTPIAYCFERFGVQTSNRESIEAAALRDFTGTQIHLKPVTESILVLSSSILFCHLARHPSILALLMASEYQPLHVLSQSRANYAATLFSSGQTGRRNSLLVNTEILRYGVVLKDFRIQIRRSLRYRVRSCIVG